MLIGIIDSVGHVICNLIIPANSGVQPTSFSTSATTASKKWSIFVGDCNWQLTSSQSMYNLGYQDTSSLTSDYNDENFFNEWSFKTDPGAKIMVLCCFGLQSTLFLIVFLFWFRLFYLFFSFFLVVYFLFLVYFFFG